MEVRDIDGHDMDEHDTRHDMDEHDDEFQHQHYFHFQGQKEFWKALCHPFALPKLTRLPSS